MTHAPTTDTATTSVGWRWAPFWVLAFVALWPMPGIAVGARVRVVFRNPVLAYAAPA